MDSPHADRSGTRWVRIRQLFDRLVEVPEGERVRRLAEACPDDPELRQVLTALLRGHDRSDEVLFDLEHPDTMEERRAGEGSIVADHPDRLIGTTIMQYRVVERLGGGGMGVLYRAEDERLGRAVVLKFLPPPQRGDPDVRRRFLQEAQAASALDHPNICTVHEIAESDDGGLFIAMAHYPGESLRDRLRRGPLSRDAALDVAIQVARGLAAVHREGIVHRDITAANLMLTTGGTVKILDFGLAKLADVTLTQAGRLMGTVAYMAPEQVRAEPLDRRTDLWSLGVVLFEMLAGRRPFGGEREGAVLYAILHENPGPPRADASSHTGPVERVVDKLLRKASEERYSDAEALLTDLQAVRRGREPPIAGRDRSLAPRRWRRRLAWGAGAAVVLWAGALAAMRLGPGPPVAGDPTRLSTIAVLPFSVTGDPEAAYLADGMVDLLSLKIDASGGRSVAPGTLLHYFRRAYPDGVDPAVPHRNVPEGGWAAEIADRFLAEYFVVGDVDYRDDGLVIRATMYSPRWWEPVGTATVTAAGEGSLLSAIDRLADTLIAAVPGWDGPPAPPLDELTTRSRPALRAYLAGVAADRQHEIANGNDLMRRAVNLDSTFALAWFNLAVHRGFFGRGAAFRRAVAAAERLPPRQRALLEAFREDLAGHAPEAERRYRRVVARYPDDVDAWRLLGDLLVRYGGFYGRSFDEARGIFERIVALDPTELRASYRLLDVAAYQGRTRAFDSIAEVLASANPPGSEDRHLYRLLPHLTEADSAAREALFDEVQKTGAVALWNGISHYAGSLGDVAALLRVNRARTEPTSPPIAQARGFAKLALLEAARGRFTVADRRLDALAELDPAWALVLRAMIASLPEVTWPPATIAAVRAQVAEWDTASAALASDTHIGGWAELTEYLKGLLSARLGDDGGVRASIARLERRGASEARGIPAAQMAAALSALAAWKRGESERALRALDEAAVDLPVYLRDSPFHSQARGRFLRGEILFAEGRYDDALRWFASLNPGVDDGFNWLFLAAAERRLGEIHERLGHPAEAAEHYRRFLALRRDGDPALRPAVAATEARLRAVERAAHR